MPRTCDLVVVANRLPVRRVKRGSRRVWETSPGGLVSALMPILSRAGDSGKGGAWVGWNGMRSGSADPFEHDDVWNVPVPLSGDELDAYYNGMSNSTLWPLYHDVIRPPLYHRSWFRAYERVNERFAEIAARHAAKGAFVWVHDYHLHLVPGLLRERRPDLRIGFFLHIPFPGRGLFAQLPWRKQIIRGTLGADVVGFQTRYGARNFIDLARRYAGAHAATNGLRLDGRHVVVDAFPISIDAEHFDRLSREPRVQERAEQFRRRLGGRTILLGVDRMDYTKGIDVRLRAFRDLLSSGAASVEDVVLIQSGVPTRETVGDYASLRSNVEELVGQINGQYGEVGLSAVQYLRQNLPQEELVSLYVAADVALVTPLRDGMNLIAKEYVASRHDNRGALVLSEFTGAAIELSRAVVVNPHDLDGLAAAMDTAIRLEPREASRRMRAMRKVVFEHDVYAWADSFMAELTHDA